MKILYTEASVYTDSLYIQRKEIDAKGGAWGKID